jgi:uncharacterized protein
VARVIPLKELKLRDADVPCGTCAACCVHDRVPLDPAVDRLDLLSWEHDRGQAVLKRRADGACVHLDQGCGVYDHRPQACRRFDCRVWYLLNSKSRRKALVQINPSLKRVFESGKRLLPTLHRVDDTDPVD